MKNTGIGHSVEAPQVAKSGVKASGGQQPQHRGKLTSNLRPGALWGARIQSADRAFPCSSNICSTWSPWLGGQFARLPSCLPAIPRTCSSWRWRLVEAEEAKSNPSFLSPEAWWGCAPPGTPRPSHACPTLTDTPRLRFHVPFPRQRPWVGLLPACIYSGHSIFFCNAWSCLTTLSLWTPPGHVLLDLSWCSVFPRIWPGSKSGFSKLKPLFWRPLHNFCCVCRPLIKAILNWIPSLKSSLVISTNIYEKMVCLCWQ